MNKTINKVLIALGIPLGLMLLFLLSPDGRIVVGILALVIAVIYLIAGILLLIIESKQLGRVLLISGGILFFVGFSICAVMFSNFH
ncbi:MAG TPA: hypothetical protein VGE90_07660 [Chitinophaga sp.]